MIEYLQNEHPTPSGHKLSALRIASYLGLALGSGALLCGLVLLLFAGPLVNRFVKPGITKAFTEAFPAYTIHISAMQYSPLANRFGFDSVVLKKIDGSLAAHAGTISVSGIGWIHLLWGGALGPEDLAGTGLVLRDIKLTMAQYELRSQRARLSVPDSELVVEALTFEPSADDEHFFGRNEFRKTRIRLLVPHVKATGLASLELLRGTAYRARSIQIRDASLDALVNKDKPASIDTPAPLMPHEILSSMRAPLKIDRLDIVKGRALYAETLAPDLEPARIAFDSLQIWGEGIANPGDPGGTMTFRGQAVLAKAGMIDVLLSFPRSSPEFTFQYSGSLGRMELSALNSFLEPVEQMRIKAGGLQEAVFDVRVTSGLALGNVRGVYRDLTLASIDKHTGSEKAFSDKVTSFMANAFKIHRTNIPGQERSFKIGKVDYRRKQDDTFIQFVWYSLRTGVQDVVGF